MGETAANLHWGSGIQRRRPGPGRGPVVASVVFHVVAVAGLWAAGLRPPQRLPDFVTYRVNLISPPPQVQGEPEPVVETKPIVTTKPQPVHATPKPTVPRNRPAVKTPKPVTAKPKPAAPAKGAHPQPGSVGGENIDVQMEGQEFPYPEYLDNIIVQLKRYFRWGGAPNLEAEVAFYIDREGHTGGMRVTQKSGNFKFDLDAMSAIEQAGRNGAFGPLPEGWQSDRLWVKFRFLPPGS